MFIMYMCICVYMYIYIYIYIYICVSGLQDLRRLPPRGARGPGRVLEDPERDPLVALQDTATTTTTTTTTTSATTTSSRGRLYR